MPRTYIAQGHKRKYDAAFKEEVLNSLRTVCKGSVGKAARLHDVPESTLRDWSKRGAAPMVLGSGRDIVLPQWVESDIVDAICVLSGSAMPLTRNDIQDLVQEVTTNLKLKTIFVNGRPGYDWCISFEKRWKHRFSRRTRIGLSYQRAKGLTQHNVNVFFDMLQKLQDQHQFLPENMWNADESGFQATKAKQMVYASKELKQAYALESGGTKSLFTVLFCVNASGTWLPTYTVYKAKNLWYEWTVGGYPGAQYGCSPSGWMESLQFEQWFITKFVPQTKTPNNAPRLFIFDGHSSHIAYKIAKCAFDNNIHILCLPPHTTHALQPLDVACFRPAKQIWSNICLSFFRSHPRQTLGKGDFPSLLKIVTEHLVSRPHVAVNGFVATGLRPINRDMVSRQICDNVVPKDQVQKEKKHKAQLLKLLGTFLESRFPSLPLVPKGRRKRVQAVEGEVLTSEESLERLREEDRAAVNVAKGLRGRGRGREEPLAGPIDQYLQVSPTHSSDHNNPDSPTQDIDPYSDPIPSTSRGFSVSAQPSKPKTGPSRGWDVGVMSPPAQPSTYKPKPSTASAWEVSVMSPPAQPSTYKPKPSTSLPTSPMPTRSRPSRGATKYVEVPSTTEESSDEEPLTIDTLDMRKLRVNSHIIWEYEGSYYPAIIKKKHQRWLTVGNMLPADFKNFNLWTYGIADKQCHFENIRHLIPPPALQGTSSGRGVTGMNYLVAKVEKYWRSYPF